MPNCAPGLPACASRERFAQRSVRSMDSRVRASSRGYSVQSSNAITTSDPSERCTAIERSGSRKTFEPSMGERNSTPASVMIRRAPRLNTWKPPESVRMGRSQCMKRCSPPSASTASAPGLSIR